MSVSNVALNQPQQPPPPQTIQKLQAQPHSGQVQREHHSHGGHKKTRTASDATQTPVAQSATNESLTSAGLDATA